MNVIDENFVKTVESAHFRTCHDTGAGSNTLLIWNMVRQHIGLSALRVEDLPAWCETHKCYHVILSDYGCFKSGLT